MHPQQLCRHYKPKRVADTLHGCAVIQRDLKRLEIWAERNLMKFSKGKYEVLQWRKNNLKCQYMPEVDHLESTFAKKHLGVLVDNKIDYEPAVCPSSKGGQQHPGLH